MIPFKTIFVAGLILTPYLGAMEIFVDQRNPNASDNNNNNGTKEKPLRSISAAVARVQAGDRVIIHAGEYRETVIIKTSGTPDAPIVFEAAPNETPVIKGSIVVAGWTRKSANVWKAKLPPLPVPSPLEDDPSHWTTKNVRQIFLKDGLLLDAIRLRPTAPDTLQEGTFFL